MYAILHHKTSPDDPQPIFWWVIEIEKCEEGVQWWPEGKYPGVRYPVKELLELVREVRANHPDQGVRVVKVRPKDMKERYRKTGEPLLGSYRYT